MKEVLKESPPPADKVLAPRTEVKNVFKTFKIRSLIYKRRRNKMMKKRIARRDARLA